MRHIKGLTWIIESLRKIRKFWRCHQHKFHVKIEWAFLTRVGENFFSFIWIFFRLFQIPPTNLLVWRRPPLCYPSISRKKPFSQCDPFLLKAKSNLWLFFYCMCHCFYRYNITSYLKEIYGQYGLGTTWHNKPNWIKFCFWTVIYCSTCCFDEKFVEDMESLYC